MTVERGFQRDVAVVQVSGADLVLGVGNCGDGRLGAGQPLESRDIHGIEQAVLAAEVW